MARPKLKINNEQVCKLAKLGVTHGEIAEVFGCDRSTITKRFSPEIARGHSELKVKLRRWQIQAAENGNTAMLIHLGKVYLGQGEKELDKEPPVIVHFDLDKLLGPMPGPHPDIPPTAEALEQDEAFNRQLKYSLANKGQGREIVQDLDRDPREYDDD